MSAQDGNLYADDDKPLYIEEVYNYEDERCEWIHDCDANDSAFTTLAKRVGMDVGFF